MNTETTGQAVSLDPESLIAAALTANQGLEDFGDPRFRDGLDVLCTALDQEAGLSPNGRALMRQKLVTQLGNRLRVEDYFQRHPEIAQEEIAAPVVIAGLPRTGTTKLHRLLARDPRFWWMAFWESQFPVPLPGDTLANPSARIAAGHAACDAMTQAMPELVAMHPMEADEPDEEVMLMEHSFLSAFNAYADIPTYSAWLTRQDQTRVYEYLKRMLQFLQWQKRQRGLAAQRWVLKAPHHLLRMDTLLRVFPGVQVVLTHRDPLQSIPSIASFIHALWGIYSDDASASDAGHEWSDLMQRALAHTMKVRETAPAQFLDVRFEDTVKQPLAVVQRIYEFVGWPLTHDAEAAMRAWIEADNQRRQHEVRHRYTADQFGLSAEQISRDFAVYRERYILTPQAATA
ncbi:MAG TPA: sulfotransferase [Nevskiaceae bacterium]|nr:sulfotransferase [Nevskiaceae bacterium]